MSREQSGAALLLCVLLLAALSVLGLSAGADALLQARMGANQAMDERDFRIARARLRALEAALAALPGEARPPGCPDACLAGLPAGTRLQEVQRVAATVEGQPETSWFLIEATHGTPPVTLRSLFARPWGDTNWTGDPGFCALLDPGFACGRVGWERVTP